MNIKLNEKKYVAPRPKLKYFRQALELTQERDLTVLSTELLDELIQYIVDVFGNQFDINELYDHYDGSFVELFQKTSEFVGKAFSAVEEDKKK